MERNLRTHGVIRLPKELAVGVLEYLWALIVVLNGNSVYNANVFRDYHLLELCLLLTAFLLAVLWFTGRIRTRTSWVSIAVGLALYSVVYVSVRQGQMSAGDFASLFVMGLPLMFLLFTSMHEQGRLIPLIRKLADVVCVLAAISLFFWLFGVILKQIKPNMNTVINWGYQRYIPGFYGLHFQVQIDTTFFQEEYLFRNSGIFTEAPMLNLWLDIALGVELFLREKVSGKRVALLAVTIFTTLSVTGVFFLMVCVLLYLFRGAAKRQRRRRVLLLVALVLLPVLAVLIGFSVTVKTDTQSYLMRISDYSAGVMLWMDHPIFGSGYGDLKSLQEYMYSPNGILGFSNSVTAVLGTGGLWIAMLFYVPHFGSVFTKWSGDHNYAKFSICHLFLFCTTAFFGRYIAVVMIAFQLALLVGRPQGGRNVRGGIEDDQ